MPKRRSVLTGVAAALTGTLGGCGAIGGLTVTDVTAESTAFGNVRIAVVIENRSSDSQSGTLIGEVEMDSGSTYTESKRVTIPGDTSTTEQITIDIPISTSLSGGSYTYDAWMD